MLKNSQWPTERNLVRVPVNAALATHVRDVLATRITTIIDTALAGPDTLREFNFANSSDDRVLALHLDDFSRLADWFGSIPPSANLDRYNGQAAFNKRVNAVVTPFAIPNVNDVLVAFGKWSPSLLLEKSGLIAFRLGPDNYQPIERENILRLNDSVDFFVFGRYVYIADNVAFESVLSFREMTREIASEAFAQVSAVLPVRNGSEVFNSLKTSSRRLKRVAKNWQAGHVQFLNLEAVDVLIQQQQLPIRVEDDEVVVDPNDNEQVDALIYIMNDAYARSVLTELWYRVHDADRISNAEGN